MAEERPAAPTLLDIRNMKPGFYTQFTVTLDGVEQDRCIVADAANGFVIRYRRTPAAWFRRQVGTERVRGKVVIAWRERKEKTDGPA